MTAHANPFDVNAFDSQRVMWDNFSPSSLGLSDGFGVPSQQKVGFGGSGNFSQTSGSTMNFNPVGTAYAADAAPGSLGTGQAPATQAPNTNYPVSNPVSTGGSSGGMSQDQKNSAFQAAGLGQIAPVGWQPTSGPSQDDINNAINDMYNSTNDYLDQAENAVESDYPTTQQTINDQYTTGQGQLDVNNTANVGQFGLQSDQASHLNENALAQARQAYSDALTGYQQRFGGSSSAGEALSAYANKSAQQSMGGINQNYQTTNQQINKAQTDTANQYQQSSAALVAQKNASLNQAQQDFTNKLLQISQSRAQNEQAKGQARLQALQDLRNQVNQISMQNTQFQQTLEAQQNYSNLQLQNYEAMAGTGSTAATNSLNNFNTYAYQPVTMPGAAASSTAVAQTPTGSINTSGKTYDYTTGTWK